jgi:hypothetical protein
LSEEVYIFFSVQHCWSGGDGSEEVF